MSGNDPSINNPYIYKHVYRFKVAIYSVIVVEMDIEQVARDSNVQKNHSFTEIYN